MPSPPKSIISSYYYSRLGSYTAFTFGSPEQLLLKPINTINYKTLNYNLNHTVHTTSPTVLHLFNKEPAAVGLDYLDLKSWITWLEITLLDYYCCWCYLSAKSWQLRCVHMSPHVARWTKPTSKYQTHSTDSRPIIPNTKQPYQRDKHSTWTQSNMKRPGIMQRIQLSRPEVEPKNNPSHKDPHPCK